MEAVGAQGGSANDGENKGGYKVGGKGAIIGGYFNLTKGDVLRVAVGGKGDYPYGSLLSGGGGGGASSIVLVNGDFNSLADEDNTKLIIAGGGGGAGYNADGK